MLLVIVLVLMVISFVWALLAYKNQSKLEEVGKVKKELFKGKVIFQSDS